MSIASCINHKNTHIDFSRRNSPRTRDQEPKEERGNKRGDDEPHGPDVELVHVSQNPTRATSNELYSIRLTFRAWRWKGNISVTTYRPYITAWLIIAEGYSAGTSCLRSLVGMFYRRKY